MLIIKKLNKKKKIRNNNIKEFNLIKKDIYISKIVELLYFFQKNNTNLSTLAEVISKLEQIHSIHDICFKKFINILNEIYEFMSLPIYFSNYCKVLFAFFKKLNNDQINIFFNRILIFKNYNKNWIYNKFEVVTSLLFQMQKKNKNIIFELLDIKFFDKIINFINVFYNMSLKNLKINFCWAISNYQYLNNTIINSYNDSVIFLIHDLTNDSYIDQSNIITNIINIWILIFKNNIFIEKINLKLLHDFIYFCLKKFNNELNIIYLLLKLIYKGRLQCNIFIYDLHLNQKLTKILLKITNSDVNYYIKNPKIIEYFNQHLKYNLESNFYNIIYDFLKDSYNVIIISMDDLIKIINKMIYNTQKNIEYSENKANNYNNINNFLIFIDKIIEFISLEKKINLASKLDLDRLLNIFSRFSNNLSINNYKFEFIDSLLLN